MKTYDLPIGTKFKEKATGKKFVVEAFPPTGCGDCAACNTSLCQHNRVFCISCHRKDEKSVIFRKIET